MPLEHRLNAIRSTFFFASRSTRSQKVGSSCSTAARLCPRVQACRHQHHAFGSDAVELVRIHVGIAVRNDVPELGTTD
jgi:hypothetical protein